MHSRAPTVKFFLKDFTNNLLQVLVNVKRFRNLFICLYYPIRQFFLLEI